jgi:putative membrane protein
MSFLSSLRIAIIGFCMGSADLVPGVSGGTVAFVAGIYDRLINGIKVFDTDLLKLAVSGRFAEVFQRIPLSFFVPLGIGLLTAVFTLSRALSVLFTTQPVQLWSFFFGLVLGSVVLLARETWPWRTADWTAFVLAAAATYVIVGLPGVQMAPSYVNFFIGGAIAICAMILPGISGSYLLVIMGLYQDVLAAVNDRDVVSIGIFVAGITFGILFFVRVVSWLLRTRRHVTLVALTGIMLGALRTVWPWKEVLTTRVNSEGEVVPLMMGNILPTDSGEVIMSIGLALAGSLVVVVLSRLGEPRPQARSSKPAARS